MNLVQRQQTWHLPDPVDPAPVERGITVYFTRLRVGGIDFAILEDRKFKIGPGRQDPADGPAARSHQRSEVRSEDRSTCRAWNCSAIGRTSSCDSWGEDWTGAEVKAVLSQTAFCGAVHMHGKTNDRLLADLDCNGWPQTPRNAGPGSDPPRPGRPPLRRPAPGRRRQARHRRVRRRPVRLHQSRAGQHDLRSLVASARRAAGAQPGAGQPAALDRRLPGRPRQPDLDDGLRQPAEDQRRKQRADGYGIVRFNKKTRRSPSSAGRVSPMRATVTKPSSPAGRSPSTWPTTTAGSQRPGCRSSSSISTNPVVQVIEEATGDVLYTRRIVGREFRPPVFSEGSFLVKFGRDRPELSLPSMTPRPWNQDNRIHLITLQ